MKVCPEKTAHTLHATGEAQLALDLLRAVGYTKGAALKALSAGPLQRTQTR